MSSIRPSRRSDQANATQSAPKIVLRHVIVGIVLSASSSPSSSSSIFDFVKDDGSDVTPFDRNLLLLDVPPPRARP